MMKPKNMIHISTDTEKKEFYDKNIHGSRAYAIVSCADELPHSICITKTWINGEARYFESYNRLETYDYEEKNGTFDREFLSEFLDEFDYGSAAPERVYSAIKQLVVADKIYEIVSPQAQSVLPAEFDIKIISETECLEWLKVYGR